ncbi:MAG: hypothetical protein KIT84_24755 [Labilithrix sp.]|nr:hypothetical protein [Labilithrix sp.]MCW5814261.1 hypothetical protein [Labilithrix sp.]
MPITVDEATADPPAAAETQKTTKVGNPGDFAKTITDKDMSSVDSMLASLEWNPPASDPKLPAAPEPTAPEPAPAPAPSEPRGPMFGKTMIGGSITAADVMAEAERTRKVSPDKPTVVGTPVLDQPAFEDAPAPEAPPRAGAPTQLGVAVSPQPAFDAPAPAPDPQAYRPAFKTMLGVALPGIAPIRDSERGILAAQNAGTPPPPASSAGTLHGGIGAPGSNPAVPAAASSRPHTAPLAATPAAPGSNPHTALLAAIPAAPGSHPHAAPAAPGSHPHAAPAAPGSHPQMQPPPPIVPPPAPLVEEPLPQAPRVEPKRGVSAVVLVAIIFGLVFAGGLAAAFVLLRGGAPLTAKARLDESGKESLEIHCESCPDGTTITLGASTSTVTEKSALLALPAPLSIGDNDLQIAIDRPGAGRDEKVRVHVPIAYRVKADLTTLGAMPPTVTVRVEATPGAEVTVDGKPTTLDDAGKGFYALDMSEEALGPSDEQTAIDRKIPFTVKRKGSASPEAGELTVRAAIVPLHLDAPGPELVTDRTTGNVAGQTRPGGTLTIDGQSVPVDATGRFAIRAELPSEGDKTLTIVASAPPLAPRTVRAKVTRVAALEAAAQTFDAASPLGFDAYAADPASKVGQAVAIDGEVLDVRVAQGFSVMVVEEKKTCAAGGGCVLRFTHGEEIRAARGDAIRAYGKVAGTVAWNGKQVPAIVGTLAIPVPKGAKK